MFPMRATAFLSLRRGANGASFPDAIVSRHREATTRPRIIFHARYNPGGSVRPEAIEEIKRQRALCIF